MNATPEATVRRTGSATSQVVHDRSIGDIIASTRNLTAEQVERIAEHQRKTGVRFGEAAVALGFANADDVLFALAQQFHYPYAAEAQRDASPELVTLNQPFSYQAEAFRAVRPQVMMRIFGEGRKERRALAVISPAAGDGKTYFAANLAVVLAQLGGRTLLVDADLRNARQHAVFNVPNDAGLSGLLAGRVEANVIRQIQNVPNLFLLPAGATPPNPLELVERPAFDLLIRELTSKFDHVVVDTPATQYGADGEVIAARCGGALIVARKDASRVQALQELVAGLADLDATIAGVVVNEY
jgi:chain length determinant protein tyrosine kinase EpsG